MQTHSGEKPFRCDQCNYSCNHVQNLKSHILTHTGAKPFACNQCNYSSIQSSHMKVHMLSHTGENPFVCKQCNYSCKRSRDLKNHMRKHSAKTKAWKEDLFPLDFFCFPDLISDGNRTKNWRMAWRIFWWHDSREDIVHKQMHDRSVLPISQVTCNDNHTTIILFLILLMIMNFKIDFFALGWQDADETKNHEYSPLG